MSKTLKTKQRFVFLMYTGLKGTPPKEFGSVDEMETLMNEILPALEEGGGEHVKFQERAEGIISDVQTGNVSEKDGNKKLTEANTEYRKYDAQNRSVEVEVEFENEPFNKFFQMFEKWGKAWFTTVGDFMEVRKSMNAANSQSPDKKKKDN